MLPEESIWVQKTIASHFDAEHFPLLNIGSSTEHFRKTTQPYIDINIFQPLREKGKKVIHLDMKKDNGVDIIGDLTNKEFRNKLKDIGIKSVLCSNLLEHLEDPSPICKSILELLHSNDLIVVTVPHFFPFHKDPIDTLFRPDIIQLHKLFPKTEIIESEIVISQDSYWNDLMKNKKYFFIMLARLVMPIYKYGEWKNIFNDFLKAKKKYSAICLLLKVKSS